MLGPWTRLSAASPARSARPILIERLAGLGGADLRSLLLAVIRARAEAATPAALSAAAARDRTVEPSAVDARRFHAADGAAFGAAAGFDAVELAPVTPLGVDTCLGRIDPDHVLATTRATQLIGYSDHRARARGGAAAARRRPRRRGPPVRVDPGDPDAAAAARRAARSPATSSCSRW